jgi:hypothetical protein
MIRNLTANRNEADELYLIWLVGLVVDRDSEERAHRSKDMFEGLFNEPFVAWIPNDDNRASEGQGLRDRYKNETHREISRKLYFSDCNFLEMMVALAHRFAWEIVALDETVEENIPPCFWTMVNNLELMPNSSNYKKLAVVNKREYFPSGKGGLFPLENHREDQTKVELWYQMQAYVMENY